MDISNAKFFVYHDMDDNVIYTSKSIDAIKEQNNRFFPISVWGVIDNGKMIAVEIMNNGEPYLDSGILGVFVHWDYFDKMYHNVKRVEL